MNGRKIAKEEIDPFGLRRFLDAQSTIYDQALSELKLGAKKTHWMWFIFPQLQGLGSSPTALLYAIGSRAEAEAYLAHPILGSRLIECAEAALTTQGRSALEIFGSPDDAKLRSSATLFGLVSTGPNVFDRLLMKFFDGEPDSKTVKLLSL